MLETYFAELRRKKIEKRIFWFFVLLSTLLLYFFFQGKYLVINMDFASFFSWSGNTQTGSDQHYFEVRSFGVLNVKTVPNDARVYINQELYRSGEQLYRPYGTYLIRVEKEWYLTGAMLSVLWETSNFYIDTVRLLPTPLYMHSPHIHDARIVPIGSSAWIGASSSGMMLYQNTFNTGTLILSGIILEHISDGIFLSGNTLVEYSLLDQKWNPIHIPSLDTYMSACTGSPSFRYGIFFCKENGTVLTPWGKTLTGVISVGAHAIEQKNTWIVGDIAQGHTFTLEASSGSTYTQEWFFSIDKHWYTSSGNTLIPLESAWSHQITTTDIDTIIHAEQFGDTLYMIGSKNTTYQIVVYPLHERSTPYTLPLPLDTLTDIRLYERQGNIFIKSTHSLLFLYGKGRSIHHIIDGKILAIGKNFALYEKDATIWEARWEAPTPEHP